MADRYWVGGAGSWTATATTHWSTTSGGASGASAPTSVDDAHFDANSGTGSVSMSGAVCKSVNFTGFTGTVSSGGFTVYGDVTIGPDVSISSYGSTITWAADGNLTTSGQDLGCGIHPLDGVTVTMQDAFTTSAFGNFDLYGNLNTNGYNLTVRNFRFNAGKTSTLTYGASVISIIGVLFIGGTLTFSGTGKVAMLSGSINQQSGGGTPLVSIPIECTGTKVSFSGTLNLSSLTANVGEQLIDMSAAVVTVVDHLEIKGTGVGTETLLYSSVGDGTFGTINVDVGVALDLDYLALCNVHFTGTATVTAANSNDVMNNSGVTITPAGGGGSPPFTRATASWAA